MERIRGWLHPLKSEHGSNVAQAAAVAILAALLIAALATLSASFSPAVSRGITCVISSLSGGGAACGGSATAGQDSATPSSNSSDNGGGGDDGGGRDGWGWTAGSIGLDVVPIVGEIKGLIEVFTGTDLVTGEELGWWRFAGLAGLVGLNEIKFLRYGDDVVEAGSDVLRRGDDVVDAGGDAGRRADDLPCPIGFAPTGKVPGLAAPIRAGCNPAELAERASRGEMLTESEWRVLIDNPPPGKTADDMRYDRYRQDKASNGEQPLNRDEWNQRKEQLEANRQRGRVDEDNTLNELGIDNNNYNTTRDGQPRDITTYTSSEGVTVRPDGVSDSHWVDVKSTTQDNFYFDQQLRAEAEGAASEGRRLAVVLTNDGSKLPTPSGPLGRNADIFYRNSSTGEWSRWDPRANGGNGGWQTVPAPDVQQTLGATP